MVHIVKSFDDDLNELHSRLLALGDLALQQWADLFSVCATYDEARIDKIINSDKELDELEDTLNIKAVEVIALRAPMAQDLRHIIVGIRLSRALERIGDYAKNSAKRVYEINRLASSATTEPDFTALLHIGKMMHAQLGDVLRAYASIDAELAMQVRTHDVEIDKHHTDFLNNRLARMEERDSNIPSYVHFLFIAKNIERAGDYITGIAEQVYFLKNATLPSDARPKADEFSKLD